MPTPILALIIPLGDSGGQPGAIGCDGCPPQLAAYVKAISDALITHGLLG